MRKLFRITTSSSSLKCFLEKQLTFLQEYYEVVGIASGKDDLHKVSKVNGFRVHNLSMRRSIHLYYDAISLCKFLAFFIKEKPFIVHANTPKASLLSMIAAWICRVPHRIYTVTGLRFETTEGFLRKLLILMEKITCACATKVIPEGLGVKNTLIKHKITSKPLEVILNGNINGIDTSYYSEKSVKQSKSELRKGLGFSEDDFIFIFVGRLVGDKGINELVQAFIKLCDYNSNSKLLLVGRFEPKLDPLSKDTRKIIESHHGIKAVGYQDDVRPFLKLSDVLAFPSYREGFPNVVLQAGSMGLPSIVTDISGSNEIINNGVNGVIIPPRDEDSLLYHMKYFLEYPDFTANLASQARGLITERYEQKNVWNAILKMYNDLSGL